MGASCPWPNASERPRDGGRSKLAQEAQVVGVEVSEVFDAVAQHRDALDAEARGEAGVAVRVIADAAQDVRVNHAGAADLQPALTATGATTLAVADAAVN